MTAYKKQIEKKEQLIHEILEELSSWDHSQENAIAIMAANNERMKKIQLIDQTLTVVEQQKFAKAQSGLWEKIIQQQEELIQFLKHEKEKTSQQLRQVGNREKFISNYINIQNQSAFVKKNY